MLITDTQMYTQILKKHKLECGNLESTYVHQRLFFIFILFIIILFIFHFYIIYYYYYILLFLHF